MASSEACCFLPPPPPPPAPLPILLFFLLLHWLTVSANVVKLKQMPIQLCQTYSWAFPLYHVANDIPQEISPRCVVNHLNTPAPQPLQCACWRQFVTKWGVAPFTVNIIIIIIITLIIIIIHETQRWTQRPVQRSVPHLYLRLKQ